MGFWVYFSDDNVEFYDSDACKLYLAPDRTIPIVQNSKVIFDYLIENRNHALYRDQIIARIDGVDAGHNFNNKQSDRSPVDTAIRELRKKLEKYKSCIDTVRGVGYMYVGPPKVEKESSDTHTNPLSSDYQTKKRKLAESILEENDEDDSSTSEQSRKSLKNNNEAKSPGLKKRVSVEEVAYIVEKKMKEFEQIDFDYTDTSIIDTIVSYRQYIDDRQFEEVKDFFLEYIKKIEEVGLIDSAKWIHCVIALTLLGLRIAEQRIDELKEDLDNERYADQRDRILQKIHEYERRIFEKKLDVDDMRMRLYEKEHEAGMQF